ncbi:MAG: protein kinase domain-containing protein [Gemmataceae bacterium]
MKAEEIFHDALARPPVERPAFLAAACAGDEPLQQRVEALLHAHENPGSFLAAQPVPTADAPITERPGTAIGPYKLIEQIGEGGMGTVWMAQQTEPVKRLVAVKLIKAGMDSQQVIARFEAECQALALMDHPNIARVLEAGTTSGGRPYFVMDLVKGVPITRYCDEHHLTPRQRLELFLPVCQAVQHSHQKGIIHRDLKPSNVLVALYDGKPVPRVIDFGVAKAAGQLLTEKTLVTGFGNIVGTPEYMSPEQAEVNQLDIDTRSDIYSLGVLLYELLAGSPPFSRKELGKAGMLEMLRVIREQEPSKPSTKLSTAEGLPALAANRGTEPAKLTRLIRGELDWIVMKALEKDRSRRYETANGFVQDLQRYLSDEPVLACPPSAAYRLRKFVGRNRRPVLAAAVMLTLLMGGVVGTTVGLFRALSAEAQALAAEKLASSNEAKARAAVNRYFTLVSEETLLDVPGFQPLREKLLDEARVYYAQLLEQGSSDPYVRAELAAAYLRMGEIYQATGKGPEFISAFQTGMTLAENLAHEHPGAPDLHRRLAGFWKGHRRLHVSRPTGFERAAASDILQKGVDVWQRFADENPSVPEFQSDLAAIMSHIGELYYEEPLQLLSWEAKALAIRERLVNTYPSRTPFRGDLAVSHILLGIFHARAGQRDKADKHLRAAVELLEELAKAFPKVPLYREMLARATEFLIPTIDAGTGPPTEKEKLCRKSLALYEDLAIEFPTVPNYRHGCAQALFYLACVLANAGQAQQAETAYRSAVQKYSRLVKEFPSDGDYLWGARVTIAGLMNLLKSAGRSQEAVAVLREAIEVYESLRTRFPDRASYRRELAPHYVSLGEGMRLAGRPRDAADAYHRAMALYEKLVVDFPNVGEYRDRKSAVAKELQALEMK